MLAPPLTVTCPVSRSEFVVIVRFHSVNCNICTSCRKCDFASSIAEGEVLNIVFTNWRLLDCSSMGTTVIALNIVLLY